MGFWPEDIFATDKQSPRQIMESAGTELQVGTKVLTVSIREARLTDRIVLAFVIQNEPHSLEFNAFEASHLIQRTYPAAIDPPDSDIPEFLMRERRIPGSSAIIGSASWSLASIAGSQGKIIKNEWICATPEEFREKLKKVLSLDIVKSNVISLLSPTTVIATSVDESNTQESNLVDEGHEEPNEGEETA